MDDDVDDDDVDADKMMLGILDMFEIVVDDNDY